MTTVDEDINALLAERDSLQNQLATSEQERERAVSLWQSLLRDSETRVQDWQDVAELAERKLKASDQERERLEGALGIRQRAIDEYLDSLDAPQGELRFDGAYRRLRSLASRQAISKDQDR